MTGQARPVRRYAGRVVVLTEEQARIVRAHRIPVEPPPVDAARLRAATDEYGSLTCASMARG